MPLHLKKPTYRCVVEAWDLLRQHTTQLNMEELLRHMYGICQEMGLMEDFLKLPLTETEQVSVGKKKKVSIVSLKREETEREPIFDMCYSS